MSEILVSKQLTTPTLPDNQMSQLDAFRGRGDSSVPNISDGPSKLSNRDPGTQRLPLSSIPYDSMDFYPTYTTPSKQETFTSFNLNEQSRPISNDLDMQQYVVPSQGVGRESSIHPSFGQPKMSMPNKRKATSEAMQDNHSLQKMSAANKRVAQVGSHAKALSVSPVPAPNKRSVHNSTKSSTSGRKVVQVEPLMNGPRSAVSKKSALPQPSPKSKSESHDSVRTKLRESLASALALVTQDNHLDVKMKTENGAATTAQEAVKEDWSVLSSSSDGAAKQELLQDEETMAAGVSIPADGGNDDKKTSFGFYSQEMSGDTSQTESFVGANLQSNSILAGEDEPFSSDFSFKDDFLQGNGLSWVSDFDSHMQEMNEIEQAGKLELMQNDLCSDEAGKTTESPESLALKIESELFKLFGSVNKKYKEKGRSLLFNLKDRSNPELRERVMSGDIPPNRLCSMTAEELASKELSEWRIAKAEEFDHMKVLPDEVNMRRLVKKTHKGEYQVDLDHDVGASEDSSYGISAPPQRRSKISKSDGLPASKTERGGADPSGITIPIASDGTDMQGLMLDDMKDLPPVISLDEFMESLNNEPPFENLPVDSVTATTGSDAERVEVGSNSRSPVHSLKYPVKITSQRAEEVVLTPTKADSDKKATESRMGSETRNAAQLHKRECVWEGQLQLSLSSTANFMASYKSGEKVSSREWAESFEIKGRVKLDAFNKFLQALPMSRSRAVMVCDFVLKEGHADSERVGLQELVDSYIADERVGFAEPASGVELYLCPPRSKTVDMIINNLPKNYTDKLNDIDDGLIAIVVWRKVQLTSSAISPNSTSQQKHKTKKQTGDQHVDNDMNRNVRPVSRRSPPPQLPSKPQPVDDEDEDAPPGFGPSGPRDEDDLPEFQYSNGSNLPASLFPNLNPNESQGMGSKHHAQVPSRQVEQMRELIQKYGQNGNNVGNGIPIEPWNDDDDDIPEWQPQASHPAPLPPPPVHNSVVQPLVANHQLHMANHPTLQSQQWPPVVQSVQPLQPPMRMQQGSWGPYGPNSVTGYYGVPGPGYNASNRRNM